MDGEGWALRLETNAQNGELESGVGGRGGGENKQAILNVQRTDSHGRTCQTTTNKNRSGGSEKNVSLQYYGSLTLQELPTTLSRK